MPFSCSVYDQADPASTVMTVLRLIVPCATLKFDLDVKRSSAQRVTVLNALKFYSHVYELPISSCGEFYMHFNFIAVHPPMPLFSRCSSDDSRPYVFGRNAYLHSLRRRKTIDA